MEVIIHRKFTVLISALFSISKQQLVWMIRSCMQNCWCVRSYSRHLATKNNVLGMIIAAYYGKPLIIIGATF